MTWEELEEEAKKMGAMEFFNISTGCEHFMWRGIKFYDIGTIHQADGSLLSKNKTPDQMLAIMKALQ